MHDDLTSHGGLVRKTVEVDRADVLIEEGEGRRPRRHRRVAAVSDAARRAAEGRSVVAMYWRTYIKYERQREKRKKREKADIESGQVGGRRVSVRAVTGAPKDNVTAIDINFALVSSLIRIA